MSIPTDISDARDTVAPGHAAIRTLSAGPNGSVVLAHCQANGREVVVKIFRPTVLIEGEAELAEHDRRVAAFLNVARMQQELSATARRWAPVHEFGPLPAGEGLHSGAYSTSDVFAASVEWLIRGHVTVNAATLAHLIGDVLAALDEMHACCQRGHGNLTPANVLLSERDPRSAKVMLTDPAPEMSADPADNPADDRWAVGALIYGLVMHKPVQRLMLLPIAGGEQWDALGRSGVDWLALCNRLLSHDPAERPALAEVAAEISQVRPPVVKRNARRLAAAGAGLVIGAGIALGAYAYAYRQACEPAERAPWLASLVTAMGVPDHGLADALQGDAYLQAKLPPLLEQAAAAGVGAAAHPLVPSLARFRAARNTGGVVAAVKGVLDPKSWPLLQHVEVLQAVAQQQGWTTVQSQLAGLTDGLPPHGPAGQAAPKLESFVKTAPVLLQSAADQHLVDGWTKLSEAARPVLASNDRDMAQLGAALLSHIATNLRLGGDNDLAAQADFFGQALVQFSEFGGSKATFDSLRQGVDSIGGSDEPPQVAALLDRIKARDVHLSANVTDLQNWLASDRGLLAQLEPQSPQRPALQKQYDEQAAAVGQVASQKWTEALLPQINAQRQQIESQLVLLRSNLRTARVSDWVASVQQSKAPGTDCPAWRAAAATLTGQVPALAADDGKFNQQRREVALWLAALDRLDAPLRAAARLPDAYAGAVQERRVAELWKAMPAFNLSAAPPPAETLVAAAQERSAWSQEIGKFADDFPLEPKYSLTDCSADAVVARWLGPAAPAANSSFWKNEVVAPTGALVGLPWLGRDREHVELLQKTAAMDRAALTAACSNSASSAELALVSRDRLDHLPATESWPKTVEELQAAGEWLKIVQPAAAQFKLDDAELAERQRQAWSRYMAAASSTEQLKSGVVQSGQFGINSVDQAAAALADHPEALYNIEIFLARQPGGSGITADQLRQAIGKLSPPDAQLASSALPPQASDERIRQAVDSDSWYHWPGATFAPQAVAPPAPPPAAVAVEDQSHQPAPASTAKPSAPAPRPAPAPVHRHQVPGLDDKVD